MNKTKSNTVTKSQKIDGSWQGDCCDVNPVYQNYLNWMQAWEEGTEYTESPEFADSSYKNRPEGFRTKSIVMRVMFDYLLLTYSKNKSIDITDILDALFKDFFKKAKEKDLKPLSEKSFLSSTKKYKKLQTLAKRKN